MSLRVRFLVGVAVFMFLVVGLVTLNLLLDVQRRRAALEEATAALVTDWVRVFEPLRRARMDGPWGEIEAHLETSPFVRAWKICIWQAGEPTVVASYPEDAIVSEGERERFERAWRKARAFTSGDRVYISFTTQGDPNQTFVAWFRPAQPVVLSDDPRRSVAEIVVLMAAATALILIVVYVELNRLVVRPLERLAEGARRVAAGDFRRPVPSPGAFDEISEVVGAFNSMMERLAEHDRQMRERVTRTERKLLVAQRLSSAGTVAAGVAHEINNPLAGLINAARALEDPAMDEARRREYVGLILDGLERIRRIVGQLLPMARMSGDMVLVDVRDPVRGAVALAQPRLKERGARLEVVLPEEAVWIRADPGEIQQAVLNVLINAADALPAAGGTVCVEVGASDHEARICVRDNGQGMDEATLSRCLDPFFTTKGVGEGTGLGLAVAHGVVMRHGGDLFIESRLGEGTAVSFVLPRGEVPAAPQDQGLGRQAKGDETDPAGPMNDGSAGPELPPNR